jgi:hypothetical protein
MSYIYMRFVESERHAAFPLSIHSRALYTLLEKDAFLQTLHRSFYEAS